MMEYKIFDYLNDCFTDSDAIDRCFKDMSAVKGEKTVIFNGKDYEIDRAIIVPDNTTVIIDGCSIKQNDEVFDNIFRGINHIVDEENPNGIPLDMFPIKNIKIIGKNNAEIVGTKKPKIGYHAALNENQPMNGDFWGWRTHMFSFSLGENIEISGLKLSETMGWAITFDNCHDVYVHDIEIYSYVKNGDGIDFRSGCHDCIVDNISGYTSDDTVACTALTTKETTVSPKKSVYPSQPYGSLKRDYNRDIYNIDIRNIFTGGLHHAVICLAARGNQVYNISVDNVKESKEGERESVVRIYTGYAPGYNPGDLHDIKLSNITSETAKYTLLVVADVKDVTFENLVQNNPDGELTSGI